MLFRSELDHRDLHSFPTRRSSDLKACIVAPPVIKVVWSGFAQKWPAGFALMKAFQVHAEDQQKLIYAVDKQGETLDQAAGQWMDQHQGDWRGWIKTAHSKLATAEGRFITQLEPDCHRLWAAFT